MDAGIQDITIVVGYKKEMFAYLQDKYPVKFIFNPLYNVKNNIESLYVARHLLKIPMSVFVTVILRKILSMLTNMSHFMRDIRPNLLRKKCMQFVTMIIESWK